MKFDRELHQQAQRADVRIERAWYLFTRLILSNDKSPEAAIEVVERAMVAFKRFEDSAEIVIPPEQLAINPWVTLQEILPNLIDRFLPMLAPTVFPVMPPPVLTTQGPESFKHQPWYPLPGKPDVGTVVGRASDGTEILSNQVEHAFNDALAVDAFKGPGTYERIVDDRGREVLALALKLYPEDVVYKAPEIDPLKLKSLEVAIEAAINPRTRNRQSNENQEP